jgi:hypothetical protein
LATGGAAARRRGGAAGALALALARLAVACVPIASKGEERTHPPMSVHTASTTSQPPTHTPGWERARAPPDDPCPVDDDWRMHVAEVGLSDAEIEQIEAWEPWELDARGVEGLAQQLVLQTSHKHWRHVTALLMVLLRSDLDDVVEEVYAQRMGGLCAYVAQLDFDEVGGGEEAAFARKLAAAASKRIYVALLEFLVDAYEPR